MRSASYFTGLVAIAGCSAAFGPAGNSASKPGEPTGEPPAAKATAATNVNLQGGATAIYRANCANCHGNEGQGGGAGTKTLLTADLYDQKHDKPFFDAIKNGVPEMGMNSYGDTMSDPVIWALVVHIRELQHRALRQQGMGPKEQNGVYQVRGERYRLEEVVGADEGLITPWAVDWLPTGEMLVTTRPGELFLFKNGTKQKVEGTPESIEIGQGGLMEVTVHPSYRQNGWVYLAVNDPGQGGGRRSGQTKIVRGKISMQGNTPRWTGTQTIFQAPSSSYTGFGVHFGSKIVFDGKGNIYFSIGDRGRQELAQDLSQPNGKIYRVREDGQVPPDNPFIRTNGALPQIWSYGHRNPQGIVVLPNGEVWNTEHGPRGGDELNQVKKGANYGWPVVSFAINYNDSPFATPWPKQGQNFEMPAFRWTPSIGACGMDVVRGNAFPAWRNLILASGLSGTNLDLIEVKDGKLVRRDELVFQKGRVRDVATAADGTIYIVLNDPGRILRLVPVR
jgi:glucose/arabinose dehydrogenase